MITMWTGKLPFLERIVSFIKSMDTNDDGAYSPSEIFMALKTAGVPALTFLRNFTVD